MQQAQAGITAAGNAYALFLLLRWREEVGTVRLRAALAGLAASCRDVAGLGPEAALSAVVALSPRLCQSLYHGLPPELAPFPQFARSRVTLPVVAADVLLHVRAERRDLLHILAECFYLAGGDEVAMLEQVDGFRYLDNRDLTGFVDGSENPQGEERAAVALLPASAGIWAGGSYVHLMRFVHDLPRWQQLSVPAQEQVIGRSKADDVELPAAELPPTAHIARVVIEEQGQELAILRHSLPYARVDEQGLLFLSYAASPKPFSRMLAQMVCADREGHYDHLLNYTRAVGCAALFAPSQTQLAALLV